VETENMSEYLETGFPEKAYFYILNSNITKGLGEMQEI